MRRLSTPLLLLFSSWLSLCASHALATTLIVGVSDNQNAPFIQRNKQQITGGILKELIDTLALRLDLEVEYLSLPRKRLAQSLATGQIHLLAHSNPAWLPNAADLYWSPAWMQDEDIFVSSASSTLKIASFDDLQARRLGVILGYRYSELDFWFEHQLIIRDDAHSLAQNFNRLSAGRIDALIDSRVMIDYYLQQHPNPEAFVINAKVAAEHDRFIALSPQAPCSIDALSEALQAMLDDGSVTEILGHYR